MFGIANDTEFLTAIGINDAPEDVKTSLIASIEELAQSKLITAISDKITEAEAEEFSNITDEKQSKEWLHQHIPDFDALVTQTMSDIKADILAHKEIIGA